MEQQKMAKGLARAVRVAVEVTKAIAEKESTLDPCPLCAAPGGTTHDSECLVRLAAESRPKVQEREVDDLLELFWVWLLSTDQPEESEKFTEQIAAILWPDGADDGQPFEDERLEQVAALLRSERSTIVPAEPGPVVQEDAPAPAPG